MLFLLGKLLKKLKKKIFTVMISSICIPQVNP